MFCGSFLSSYDTDVIPSAPSPKEARIYGKNVETTMVVNMESDMIQTKTSQVAKITRVNFKLCGYLNDRISL